MSRTKEPTHHVFPRPIAMSRAEMIAVVNGKRLKAIKSGDFLFLQELNTAKVYIFDHVCACANLPEPEKNIRELVEHFQVCHDFTWDNSVQGQARHKAGERPDECGECHTLAPFKEKNNADIKIATP